MRTELSAIHQSNFDVVVVGAGANGASAALHLQAAGYQVLLVDKADYGGGTSARSSRLLSNGLKYLAPGTTLLRYVLDPVGFIRACRMARLALRSRTEVMAANPKLVRKITFGYPLYDDSRYAPWQIAAAFGVLGLLNRGGLSVGYRPLLRVDALREPLLRWLRAPSALRRVVLHDQYQVDFPERLVVDTVMTARGIGAVVRNYTTVTGLRLENGSWIVDLTDAESGVRARVSARAVVNTAGLWIDKINRLAKPDIGRRVWGTKGVHIAVRLSEECERYALVGLNRLNENFLCIPWRGLHYFGPTETPFEGDIEDIHPTEEEVEWLLGEANHLLPGAELARADVVYAWAGVRPLTYDAKTGEGNRKIRLHDLADEGLPGLFALTAGPIYSFRSTGKMICTAVRALLGRAPRASTIVRAYASTTEEATPDAPGLESGGVFVSFAQLRHAASVEDVRSLVDLLFQRVGLGWGASVGGDIARQAAEAVADVLGWDASRIVAEVESYSRHVQRMHLVPPIPSAAKASSRGHAVAK
jgi:glycerol-3-phosphate dehydrogenase